MPIFKRLFLLTGLILSNISAFSQYSVNSPYSRYGIGEIDQSGFGQNRAMGGIGIGMRENNQLNPLNPASYTSQDTMSFLWDFGMLANRNVSKTSSASASYNTANFDHLSMSFPITKWYYASAGMVPFSNVGYDILDQYNKDYSSVYKGSGSINQLYFGNAFGLFNKKLNLGFNVCYLFGSLNQDNTLIANGKTDIELLKIEKRYVAKGLKLNFGAQGVFNVGDKINVVAGIVFDPKSSVKLNTTDISYRYVNIYNDTISGDTIAGKFTLPGRLGLGASIKINNQWVIGADYVVQDWSSATFLGRNDSLGFSNKINVGVQFIPNPESFRSYFQKINYRAGAYYNDTYLTLQGNKIKDYGFTFGLGLPFKNNHTMFHVSADFGRRGTTNNNLVEINYTRINFSLTLYDFWFMKRKYD